MFGKNLVWLVIQEEADRREAERLQAEQAKEALDERRYQERLEQERQDHELALRLAQESNGQIEESPPMIRKYEFDCFKYCCPAFSVLLVAIKMITISTFCTSLATGRMHPLFSVLLRRTVHMYIVVAAQYQCFLFPWFSGGMDSARQSFKLNRYNFTMMKTNIDLANY